LDFGKKKKKTNYFWHPSAKPEKGNYGYCWTFKSSSVGFAKPHIQKKRFASIAFGYNHSSKTQEWLLCNNHSFFLFFSFLLMISKW
jgi:hypothetical protein